MENILRSRVTLHFYGGVDAEGKEMFKTKTFSNVDNTATSGQLKRAAQALALLQEYTLETVTRNNQYDIFN
jgi:aspartyl/asparaginyl-tRNA synthetase